MGFYIYLYICSFYFFKGYYSYSLNGGLLTKILTEVIKEHCSLNSSSPQLDLDKLLEIAQDRLTRETVYVNDESNKGEAYQVGITTTTLQWRVMLKHLEEENGEKEEVVIEKDEENEEFEAYDEDKEGYIFEQFFGLNYAE